MQKFRLISAAGCILAATLLLVFARSGLWLRWGLGLGTWYMALGGAGLLYCASAFISWLVGEQKTGKIYGGLDAPNHDKENHDGV